MPLPHTLDADAMAFGQARHLCRQALLKRRRIEQRVRRTGGEARRERGTEQAQSGKRFPTRAIRGIAPV